MKKYQFEGYDIAAPISINSNEPMFDADSISLKKQRSSQGVQRWELSFGVTTNDPASLLTSIVDFDTIKTMPMIQLNDVNRRIGSDMPPTTTTYAVTASGGKYYIDGVQNPSLSFKRKNTYIFDMSDSSLSSHPLRFSTTSGGTHGGGTQYTDGVTVTGIQGQANAKVEIIVSNSAPGTLYYYCTNHVGMGNAINITDPDTLVYPKGAFVTGSNNKVYMVKSDALSIADSNLYPTPVSGLTYSTIDNATIRYYRAVENVKGITFTDGIIANPGTIDIIEAV